MDNINNFDNILSDFFKKNIEINKDINTSNLILIIILLLFIILNDEDNKIKIKNININNIINNIKKNYKKPLFIVLTILFIISVILLIYNQTDLNKTDDNDKRKKISNLIWTSVFTQIFLYILIILIILMCLFSKKTPFKFISNKFSEFI